ncbi:MAG: CotH kinase family protein [Saprospiraceae bacterium]|nr:CotH kinase family protein [Saprospiraceae bacterium]
MSSFSKRQLYCLVLLQSFFIGSSAQGKLFDSDTILELELSGDTRSLFNDREGEASYFKMELTYQDSSGEQIVHPLKVKTRGNFRRDRTNCFYPPLWLNFPKSKIPENSVFAGQDKIKLVTPCRDQKYVVREYLAYKLYQMLSPMSFQARLVKVRYKDSSKGKSSQALYGIILEDKDEMAARNGGKIIKRKKVRPNKTDQSLFLKMATFEYLIGNTDWSIEYQHNVKLMLKDGNLSPLPVPYDFDHAGIVRAPYAQPAPALQMSSIQERRYRGYCVEDMSAFEETFAFFNTHKEAIYKLYQEHPLLEKRYKRSTGKFLDTFYKTINSPKASKKAFLYPCNKQGTAKFIIRGLNTD